MDLRVLPRPYTARYLRLSKVNLPELLEHVSVGEVLEADSNLSTCINIRVFSFVMVYNNENVGGLFGCNFTFCVPNSTFDSPNSLYLKKWILSDTILGVSEIRIRSVFHKQKS